jgi:hypothetical protein
MIVKLINWLAQVFAVTGFNIRSLPQRLGSSATAVVGIAGVVAVMVGVLSIATGVQKTMASSAATDNAIVLRSGSTSEMTSGLTGEDARIIADAPGIARSRDGPLASPELYVIIDWPKLSTGTDANVPLRGVTRSAFAVRDRFELIEGRLFEWGLKEVIAGVGASGQFAGLRVGDQLPVSGELWPIVGIMATDGGIAESEIWADAAVLQPAFRRGNSYQSMFVKLASIASYDEFKDSLTSDPPPQFQGPKRSRFLLGANDTDEQPDYRAGHNDCGDHGPGCRFWRTQHHVFGRVGAQPGDRDSARARIPKRSRGYLGIDGIPDPGHGRRWYRLSAGLSGLRRYQDRKPELGQLQPDDLCLRRHRIAADPRCPFRAPHRLCRWALSGGPRCPHAGCDCVTGAVSRSSF